MPKRLGLTTALLRVSIWTLPVGAYSTLALLKDQPPFSYVPEIPLAMEAGLVFSMSVLIAFRVNRAYERWWEARTLWGQLVNVSRNLAVKVRQFPQPTAEEAAETSALIASFALGLKDHLRDEADLTQLPSFTHSTAQPKHIPTYIVGKIYELLGNWKRTGRITDAELWILDTEARALLDVCGACERIKTTLPSVSWRWFTLQVIAVFVLVLPWGLADDFGVWTIPLSMAICYFVIGGEGIAQFVEEPFGHHEDHLDLDSICMGIERSVGEALGEERSVV